MFNASSMTAMFVVKVVPLWAFPVFREHSIRYSTNGQNVNFKKMFCENISHDCFGS